MNIVFWEIAVHGQFEANIFVRMVSPVAVTVFVHTITDASDDGFITIHTNGLVHVNTVLG